MLPCPQFQGDRAMRGQVILSHGSDSSPDATKVSALAKVAE